MLAILYDVHGNLPALEAVLEDAAAAGAERFVLGAITRSSAPGRPRRSNACARSTPTGFAATASAGRRTRVTPRGTR